MDTFNNVSDAQSVLDALHSGKAKIIEKTKQGNIVVRVDYITGFNNNPRSGFMNQPTNIFMIKGSKK